eukprot:7363325-Pyramimonas_sp.AAC.1
MVASLAEQQQKKVDGARILASYQKEEEQPCTWGRSSTRCRRELCGWLGFDSDTYGSRDIGNA